MRMFSRRIRGETPELREEGVRLRFIGRREGVSTALARADGLGRGSRPPATTGSRCSSPSTTAAGPRSSTPPQRYDGGGEEEFRALLYAPEMHDPDLIIRTSGEQRLSQLPAVAVRVLRARLPRRALARLHARGVRGRRSPSTPSAGAAMAAGERRAMASGQLRRRPPRERPRRAAAAAAARRSDLGARILVAIPAIAVAGARRLARRARLRASRCCVLGWLCLARALRGCSRARTRRGSPASSALLALIAAAHYGDRDQVLLVAVAALPVTFLLTLAAPRGERLRDRGDAARRLVDRARARARRAAARPAARRRDRHRRARRHVRRRHRRLPRRAQLRPPPARAARSRRTRPSRGSSIGIVCAVVGVWFASLYQAVAAEGRRAPARRRRRVAAPLGDLFESYVKRARGREGHRRGCSAPTAARSTASTRCCSAVVAGYYVWLAILGSR